MRAGNLFFRGRSLFFIVSNKLEIAQTSRLLAPGTKSSVIFIEFSGANMARPGYCHRVTLSIAQHGGTRILTLTPLVP